MTTTRRVLAAIVVVMVALLGACGQSSTTSAGSAGHDSTSGLPWILESDLPAEAQHELDLIDAGGPFRYPGKDGSTFGNYEGVLPDEPRGYYHEYTVDTPGSEDRGARRIITGREGEYYYTQDHYESFSRIRR